METTIEICGFRFRMYLSSFGDGPGIDSRALGDYYPTSEPKLVDPVEWDEYYPGQEPTMQAMQAAIEENEDLVEEQAQLAWKFRNR